MTMLCVSLLLVVSMCDDEDDDCARQQQQQQRQQITENTTCLIFVYTNWIRFCCWIFVVVVVVVVGIAVLVGRRIRFQFFRHFSNLHLCSLYSKKRRIMTNKRRPTHTHTCRHHIVNALIK